MYEDDQDNDQNDSVTYADHSDVRTLSFRRPKKAWNINNSSESDLFNHRRLSFPAPEASQGLEPEHNPSIEFLLPIQEAFESQDTVTVEGLVERTTISVIKQTKIPTKPMISVEQQPRSTPKPAKRPASEMRTPQQDSNRIDNSLQKDNSTKKFTLDRPKHWTLSNIPKPKSKSIRNEEDTRRASLPFSNRKQSQTQFSAPSQSFDQSFTPSWLKVKPKGRRLLSSQEHIEIESEDFIDDHSRLVPESIDSSDFPQQDVSIMTSPSAQLRRGSITSRTSPSNFPNLKSKPVMGGLRYLLSKIHRNTQNDSMKLASTNSISNDHNSYDLSNPRNRAEYHVCFSINGDTQINIVIEHNNFVMMSSTVQNIHYRTEKLGAQGMESVPTFKRFSTREEVSILFRKADHDSLMDRMSGILASAASLRIYTPIKIKIGATHCVLCTSLYDIVTNDDY